MKQKLSISDRIRVAVTGSTKGIVPSLPNSDDVFGTEVPLPKLVTKTDQLNTNIGWVSAANDAIVEEVASVELKLYRVKGDGDREEVNPGESGYEVLDLINEPNAAHDGRTIRYLFHSDRNLIGEAFMLMTRAGQPYEMTRGAQLPDALQILPSYQTTFDLSRDGLYSNSKVKYNGREYKAAEVLKSFRPNPADIYHGLSVVAGAASAIATDSQMQAWNHRMFANNARPGLIFNLTGEQISPEVYERLSQQVKELYTNDGVFRSLVVENGDVKPYMLTQQDLDFLNSRAFTRDEILAMFKLPGALLGMTKDYNRANIEGARLINSMINVVPRLNAEMAMWNKQLVKPFDPTLVLAYVNPIPEDRAAKLKEAVGSVNSFMTIDEVRELYGLEGLDDDLGAQMYVPINSVPLASIAAPKATKPAQDEEGNPTEGKKSLPKPRATTART